MSEFKTQMREYIMNDTVTKERFSDIEICCEEDNLDANEAIDEILCDYTESECERFLEAMKRNCDIIEGGWKDGDNFYPEFMYKRNNGLKGKTVYIAHFENHISGYGSDIYSTLHDAEKAAEEFLSDGDSRDNAWVTESKIR